MGKAPMFVEMLKAFPFSPGNNENQNILRLTCVRL